MNPVSLPAPGRGAGALPGPGGSPPLPLPVWFRAIPAIWTLLIVLALSWNISHLRSTVEDLARIAARSGFEKDLLFRRWASMHGGVYVPVTATTQPNPYLVDIPERDISTPSGRRLTLMNPAYMTRQVHELGRQLSTHVGHITSLRPLRPENAPDDWERRALLAFEHGEKEVSSIELRSGERYLRLMRPLKAEAACLKCHARQGYREGDIRGGISLDVPMKEYESIVRPHLYEEFVAHGGIWLLGLGILMAGGRQIRLRRREIGKVQAALQESEARFRAMFEDSPVAVWEEDYSEVRSRLEELRQSGVSDLRAFFEDHPDEVRLLASKVRVVEINQTSVRVLGGRDKAQFLGGGPGGVLSGCSARFKEQLAGLAEGRMTYNGELVRVDAEGKAIVLDTTASVQPGYESDWSRVLVSFIDVTKRRRSEEALRERNRFIETILENAPIGFAVNTIHDGQGVFVGSRFEEIYGVPRGSLHTVDEYFEKVYLDSVFREQIRARMLADMASGNAARMRWEDLPITTSSGEKRYVSAINIPLIEQNLMVSTVHDVTARHLAEEALRASEALYHDLVETSQDLIWQCDAEGRYIYLNPAWEETLGYRLEEILGKQFADFVSPDCFADDRAVFQRLLNGQAVKGHETIHLRKDGKGVRLVFNAKCVRNREGEVVGTRGTAYDITERKANEERVRHQMEELQRWYKVTLGREDRVQELKREVNQLLARLGEPVRYTSQAESS